MDKKDAQRIIDSLKEEAYNKLDEIATLALEHDIPVSFELSGRSSSVLLRSTDEDTLEMMKEDYEIEPGEWVSSSHYC